MQMHPLAGHQAEKERVLRAIAEDRLPQMILVTGPPGVGKQRFGLWVAQAILCEASEARPCGQCRACIQVLGLGHPDLHWLMPVPRPKAAEPEKQVEELGDTIGAVLEERRKAPLYQPADGLAGHFVATARLLQRRAALTPAAGRKKVFLVAGADRLVPQEANPEAANALLKLLEEPPGDSQFLLTVVDPNRLLPTIRSRVVPLRLGRLPDSLVEQFLAERAGLSGADLKARVGAAGGSIGRALALGEDAAKATRAADELLRAVAGGAGPGAERSLKQGPWAARGDFTAMLDSLAETLADAARVAAGQPSRRPLPETLTRRRSVEGLIAAQGRVQSAREAAQGNVNPQLLLAVLADDLAEVL
jgi:DNA polymerase III subunit delta'